MKSDETAGLLRRIKALELENAELKSLLERVEDPVHNIFSPEALVQILDGIEADIYVADIESYDVLFMNRHMIESFGGDYTGEKCYKAFTVHDEPCPHCTTSQLFDENGVPCGPVHWEAVNSLTGRMNMNVDRVMRQTNGRLVKVQVATDLTERLEAERALRKSETMLKESQAMARVGGWEYDPASDTSTWTDEVYRILEFDPALVPTLDMVLSVFSGEDRETLRQHIKRAGERHEPYDLTLKLRTSEGNFRWVRIKGRPVVEEGQAVRLSGTVQDVTEQHEAEEERRHWLGMFEKLVQASPNCIIQLDMQGRLNYVSPRGLKLFGITDMDGYYGKRAKDWVAPEFRELAEKNLRDMIEGRTEQIGEKEYLMLKADGETFHGALNASVIRDQEGKPSGVIAIVRDISEKHRMNMNLIEAKEQAEAASTAKGEFLANMSHEIRTPLNGVLGMLQLAMLTNLDQEQREYIETALNSGRSLLRIINDVLDFSKIEAGKVEIGKEDFCLQDMVDSVIEVFRNQAGRKRIELSREISKGAPEIVIGDEGRLRQILFNLVGNALKFTDTGEIIVKVTARQEEDQYARLFFEVRDTGIGIPEDKVDRIFESFTQVDGSYTRKHAGTGLGLSIVKRLVELMGGKIEIASKLGQGTSVSFDVLLGMERRAEERKMEMEDSEIMPEMNKSRLLLVEDDDINRITTRLFLEKLGYEVGIAVNGREALERCEEETYDVVLMDIQMPEMDGLEAARRIRDGLGGKTPKDVPIIAITAHAMKGDRERFLNSGMDEYVAKPLEMRELARVLERLTSEVTQKA